MARLVTRPSAIIMARTALRNSAFSLIISATMWRAPSSASSARHAELRGDFGERRGVVLFPEEVGERFQALLARDGGLGAALRLVGQVEIFELGLFERGLDLRLQLRREFALFLNGGEHGFAAVFEFAEVLELLLDVADLDFVQIAGDFLAVARDEGHGGAFVEQFDDGIHAFQRDVQQLGDMYEYGGGECLQFSHDSAMIQ